jgi:hypothetical protein
MQINSAGVFDAMQPLFRYTAGGNSISGLTRGTVSQTMQVLEKKGLLGKQDDVTDRRLVHLKPTQQGMRLVGRSVPAKSLVSGLQHLAGPDSRAVEKVLSDLLQSIQKANGYKTFTPCHSCRFNQQRDGCYFRGLMQEPLKDREVLLICREHQYPLMASAKQLLDVTPLEISSA